MENVSSASPPPTPHPGKSSYCFGRKGNPPGGFNPATGLAGGDQEKGRLLSLTKHADRARCPTRHVRFSTLRLHAGFLSCCASWCSYTRCYGQVHVSSSSRTSDRSRHVSAREDIRLRNAENGTPQALKLNGQRASQKRIHKPPLLFLQNNRAGGRGATTPPLFPLRLRAYPVLPERPLPPLLPGRLEPLVHSEF